MFYKIKDIIKTDFSGFIFMKLRSYRLTYYSSLTTYMSYIKLRLKGVKIAKGCNFYKMPIVSRDFNSEINIGANCTFRSDRTSNLVGLNRKCTLATFNEHSKIIIGEKSGFSGTVIAAANSVTIGSRVLSGANVLITDFDWHAIDPKLRQTNEGVMSAPVVIKDNVWLGINTVVLKGVTIGENSVIGANSLVVKDIPANVIAAGNPCKILKEL